MEIREIAAWVLVGGLLFALGFVGWTFVRFCWELWRRS